MCLVCLVDGVGRPKLLDIPELVETIEYAHEGITAGLERRVKFDRTLDETDPDGRRVYRMRSVYRPTIRHWYLRVQTIEPFNPPRVP